MKKYVNVYEVTREFGGHEEGGWWFNWYEFLDTVECKSEKEINDMQEKMYEKYQDHAYGNINSVNGGLEIRVLIESKPREYETTERPFYE